MRDTNADDPDVAPLSGVAATTAKPVDAPVLSGIDETTEQSSVHAPLRVDR
jgi:hypothetical protein